MIRMSFQDKLFERLRNHSDHIAIEYGDREITYAQLEERVHLAACWIIGNGIEKGDFIGIYLDDRIEFITLLLGILKVGCVFIPLDTAHPIERIKQMVETTRPQLIFSDKHHHNRLLSSWGSQDEAAFKSVLINEDFYKEAASSSSEGKWEMEYSREDKIYIYFTSGSTGIPKAIVGKNKSLLHFIDWEIDTFGVDDTFRVSQFTTPAFDASLRDIFVPLMAGGTICIPENMDILTSGEQLIRWLDDKRIHLIHCVPSLFRMINTDALCAGNFKYLKYLLLSGEKINPFELKNWYDKLGERIQLVNLYGPTETTMIKTVYFIQKEDVKREKIPIGKPIRGSRVIILDKNKQVCEPGIIGEIHIRTPYRTFGYYHDPQLNRERFIPNPFNNDPADLIYKTGDLGVLAEDGNLFWLGRIDRQVKIRGCRVELEEIEHHLGQHSSVKDAVVKTVPNPLRRSKADEAVEGWEDDEYICAYIILAGTDSGTGKEPETWEFREYLSQKLPDYMIPSYFVYMEKLPLTVNGKIDRVALPIPKAAGTGDNYKAPRNAIEEKLAAIWSDVLAISPESISMDANFFELGGHSLRAITVVSHIQKVFHVKMSLAELFKIPTIGGLARYIEGMNAKERHISIEPVEEKEYYILSSAQKRLYILHQMDMQSLGYNMPTLMVMEGDLNKEKLEGNFRKLIERHENLRTSFMVIDEEPVQKTHKEVEFRIEFYDLARTQIEAEEGKIIQNSKFKIQNSFVRPFDLTKAPLLRVGLIKLEEKKHILMVDMHHIISDAISHLVLARDFLRVYAGEDLSPLRFQYKDYCLWQNSERERERIKQQGSYWLKQFSGPLPVFDLPIDYPRPANRSFEGSTYTFRIGKERARELKKLAVKEGATLQMVMLAIFNVLLFKISGQEDIIVGTSAAGRVHPDLEKVIGVFINTLALRNFPTGETTFHQFLKAVKENSLNAYQNQDYPFENLVKHVWVNRDANRNPLFDVMFEIRDNEGEAVEIPGVEESEVKIKPYEFENSLTIFDLDWLGVTTGEDISFSVSYCTKLFQKESIELMAEEFLVLIDDIINGDHLYCKIKDLECSTPVEKELETVQTIEFDF